MFINRYWRVVFKLINYFEIIFFKVWDVLVKVNGDF